MATGTIKKLQDTDSGWINLSLTSDFQLYNAAARARYRKVGKLVEVQGTVKPTSELANGGNNAVLANLPVGYRPSADNRVFICQGSTSNRWALTIYVNGDIGVARYGTTEFIPIPTSAWLPFDITFLVD